MFIYSEFPYLWCLVILLTSFSSCQDNLSPIPTVLPETGADVVWMNAKIYTVDNTNSIAQAVAIKGGSIVYVGTNEDVKAYIGAGTQVENLDGKMVLPGIHDVHMHPLEAGSPIGGSCELDGTADDIDLLIQQIENCSLQPNSNGWITAFGHSIFTLLDENLEQAPVTYLDDLFPDIPVVIMEETSHSTWVNSKALMMAGISLATPDPIGGHIVKQDIGGGVPELQGILLDNAGDVVLAMALATNQIIEDQNYDGLINYSLPLLTQNGITSICEGRTYWKRNYHKIWKRIKDEDKLTVRVVLGLWAYPDDDDTELISKIKSLFDDGDDMLRAHQVKVYSDGITINATAALHEEYYDNLGWPFTRGLNYISVSRLTNLITNLELEGFDFHIHAIGDRGITESIDAIEAARMSNGNIDARHRITHLEIVKNADIPRFSPLNIIADMQVAGDFAQPTNWSESEFLIGPARSQNLVPLRSFFDAGAHVVLSSDWDVSSVNPFVGMQNALTRSPQNLPDINAVIRAYTINAAYVMRQEDRLGSVEVGKLADLIVIDQDLTVIDNSMVGNTQVLQTMLGGEIVYRK